MRSTDPYDKKAKEWAERLRSGKNLAHTYLEKPAMYGKLPDLKNKNILCIGCGSGEECEHILGLGAEKVVGIDLSKELIAIAKKSYPNVEFRAMDMRKIDFPKNSFDFAYSSLAMHYLKDWAPTLKKIRAALRPDGTFLFSTHHPVYWSAEILRGKNGKSRLLGYEKANGRLKRVWGDYQNTHRIDDIWFGDMEVSYYHNPISKILKEIKESGFVVADFIEPKPQASLRKADMDDYALFSKIPLFMIFELKKG